MATGSHNPARRNPIRTNWHRSHLVRYLARSGGDLRK